MPITSVTKDADALTMTVVADFTVPRARLWAAYTDPRQIEKFWGPVGWPATFTRHDVFPGGRSHYYMTGPDGEIAGGYWEHLSVDPGHSFEVRDGFADEAGQPTTDMPTMRVMFVFEDTESGSRLITTTAFDSADDLEKVLGMGMEEGLTSAMSQIDDVVADLASFAADRTAELQILSDTQIRVSRIVRGTVDQVWRAHHEPDLLKRWMLGPDGWVMTVCEVAQNVGDAYRNEWAPIDDAQAGFGFTGELIEHQPPHREVTTERMVGTDGPSTTNAMTLTPVDGGTLVVVVITYPDVELRDQVIATGMVDGMEASYARLERTLDG